MYINTNNNLVKFAFISALALLVFMFPHLAHADDLFASGKQTVTDSVGDGSTVNYIIILAAAVGGVLVGIIQKNWVLGIVTFFGANVFWSIAMGIAGGI